MNSYSFEGLLEKVALLLVGYILSYLLSYLGWNIFIFILSLAFILWSFTKRPKIKSDKSRTLEFLSNLEDVPAWVMFPDTERAEWLNEILYQMWSPISTYFVKQLRGPIQSKIRKKHGSFLFENVDLGRLPPKIEGVQVYKSDRVKDSIVIDFDIFYDGDCDIHFSYSGAHGGIKEFQLKVLVRVVLKPLMAKLPFVGAMEIFFLNMPEIDFELYGITGIPGLRYFMSQTIEKKLTKLLVFPNKCTIRFSKSAPGAKLRSIQPDGVLRVHVFEAKNLQRKDVTGKSDPYVILTVGAQEHRTQVIRKSLNPQWDYWCEFYILDPASQILGFKLYDDDEFREDDFLGNGEVDIKTIIKNNKTDQWFKLENAKHGEIHLRFTWLSLSSKYENLKPALEEAKLLAVPVNTCLLMVYIDSAQGLPMAKSYKKPHPYLILKLGKTVQKTKAKKYTINPTWEQGFIFFVRNPEEENLSMTIMDKQTDTVLDKIDYSIRNLEEFPELQLNDAVLDLENEGNLIASLQLRVLIKESTFDHSDSDSDDGSFGELGKTKEKEELMPKSQWETLQKPNLGRIELTIDYSVVQQKLLVIVHKINDLPVKDLNELPEAYVTVELSYMGSPSKKRTRIEKDNANPVYEEKFNFTIGTNDVVEETLVVMVKNKKKHFFSGTHILGRVDIPLNDIVMKDKLKAWYDLGPSN